MMQNGPKYFPKNQDLLTKPWPRALTWHSRPFWII